VIVDECAEHTRDPTQWQAIENMLGPFALKLLQTDAPSSMWELGVKLLVAITFEPPFPNGPGVWSALPVAYKCWQHWAKDYMVELAELWDNFLTNDPARCAGTPEILAATNDMIHYALRADTDIDQREGGLKMLESMLANLRGKVDALVPKWLGLLFLGIKHELAEQNLENVLDLACHTTLFFWYNPVMTLQLLESNKATAQLLDHVLANAEELYTKKSKKMVLLGLSALLHVAPDALPVSVKQRMAKLAAFMLKVQMDLWKRKDEDAKLKEAEEAGEAEFDDDDRLTGASMPDDQNVDDFTDVNDLNSGGVIDVDFDDAADMEDFAGMQMAGESELCATLEKFDEVVFWADGWRKLANASKDFAGIVNGMNKKNKDKQGKLFALAEEKRRAGPPAAHKKR
jgi:hypothetical protein